MDITEALVILKVILHFAKNKHLFEVTKKSR